jgi:hypothetical protein
MMPAGQLACQGEKERRSALPAPGEPTERSEARRYPLEGSDEVKNLISLMTWLLIGSTTALGGSDSDLERATLRGINEFSVVVEDPGLRVAEEGLRKDQIQADAELRLRKASIPITEFKGGAFLYVSTNLVALKDGRGFAYSLKVSFDQTVVVVTNKVVTATSTWSVGSVGFAGSSVVTQSVREDIGDLVDRFINAYLSVNPK